MRTLGKHFIHSPTNPKYPASSAQVNELLGLNPTAKMPSEGLGPKVIQGIKVWITSLDTTYTGRRKRSTHRVMAECPECLKVLSVGRLAQHVCPVLSFEVEGTGTGTSLRDSTSWRC